MKTLLTAGALLVASSTAFAGTYTEMAEFGVQGSLDDKDIGFGFTETVTVAGFDASLGNLTGVEITVYSQIDATASSTNNSLDGASRFKFDLDQDWQVTSAAGDFLFNAEDTLFELIDSDHVTGETFAIDQSDLNFFRDGAISASDLALFASDVDFVFDVFASANFQNSAPGTGDFTNVNTSAAWGKVEVSYTYDAVVASVPETGSLAIFGLGLAGFALSRKAKKSA